MDFPFVREAISQLFSKPSTVLYPVVPSEAALNYRGRIVYHPEKCINCGMCERVCSGNAITTVVEKTEEGDKVTGTVLEISPTSLYLVTCTVSNVSKTAETSLIHSGEAVYMKCTADASHRATGVVTKISGTSYEVEATGGELYVGETVYVYRDAAFTTSMLIGRGTVTSHDTLAVEGEGTLLSLRADVGDPVARGQWLFSTAAAEETRVSVPVDGIITAISADRGSSVKEDAVLATIATASVLRIEVSADDAARFRAGDTWYYTRSDDPHEIHLPALVKRVLTNESDASASVELVPAEAAELPLGLTIYITDEPGLEE